MITYLTFTRLPPLTLFTHLTLRYLQTCSPGITNFYAPSLLQLYYLTNVHFSMALDTYISTVAGPQSPGCTITSLTKHSYPPLKVKSSCGVRALYT